MVKPFRHRLYRAATAPVTGKACLHRDGCTHCRCPVPERRRGRVGALARVGSHARVVADPSAVVVCDAHARFSVLGERLVRAEYSSAGAFATAQSISFYGYYNQDTIGGKVAYTPEGGAPTSRRRPSC